MRDLDVDVDLDGSTEGLNGLTGFMLTFGLTGVPVTVVFSFITAIGWLSCYFVDLFLLPLVPFQPLQIIAGAGILAFSFFLSVVITAQLIKPLKGVFKNHTAISNTQLVGQTCVVTTGSVTETIWSG